MIEKLINQGYRLYIPFPGFRFNESIKERYLNYRNLVVDYNKQLNLILVRDATNKERLQASQ